VLGLRFTISKYGECKNCGAPLVKGRPYKTDRSSWGLTSWACNLVCSVGGDGTFQSALGCHFQGVEWAAELAERPLFDLITEHGDHWRGGYIEIPFKGQKKG